jgi:anthranilate phosphoribosyltransferase
VLDEVGITFLFAPAYHPLLARVAGVRRALKQRTVFNWLGPVCNPGNVRAQVIGCPTEPGLDLLAEVLIDLDDAVDELLPRRRALIVHAADGADELTLSGVNHVCGVNMDAHDLDAAELGLSRALASTLVGGDAAANLALLGRVLDAEPSPIYDAVRLNATAALLVDGHPSPAAALEAATESLRSGRARDLFARWIGTSRALRGRA